MAGVVIGLAHTSPAAPFPGAKSTYLAKCANCHGRDGRGDGPAAGLLDPAPRDFTKGIYKFRSTPSGSVPSDGDLVRTISVGLPGTSMPGWRDRLSAEEIGALVAYVRGFSPRFASERPTLLATTAPVPTSADSIAKGRKAYADLACAACHGDGGTTAAAKLIVLKDDWGHDLRAADLTQPWTFRGGAAAADIYLRLKSGIDGTPMPAFASTAKDADLWHLANYVASLGRKPIWKMNADELHSRFEQERRAAAENPVERGRYLAVTANCAHCHTPVDAEGRELPGLRYAGGQHFNLGVWGDRYTANLTSDNETGIGRMSDDDLKRAITRGIKRDDTRMLPFPMGWPAFASMTDEDLKALVAYLRTIAPVSNRIPPSSRPNIAAFLGAKFKMLILGHDDPLIIYAGNAGSAR